MAGRIDCITISPYSLNLVPGCISPDLTQVDDLGCISPDLIQVDDLGCISPVLTQVDDLEVGAE